MKTVQDWGFISKDQGLVKPKLQDNKIFHALTSAYENNQQQEIYGATENIVRREKELCELALADLKRLAEGKGEADATLKLIMEHYSSRLLIAREKEERINHLSEDTRKMTEEYKKKTQELADVKRSLMESQGKLRELAKTTEKLLKREEELRFIESNLRTEIDKNKRNIINGLYEIVADLPETPALPLAPSAPAPAPQAAQHPNPPASMPVLEETPPLFQVLPSEPAFGSGSVRAEDNPAPAAVQPAPGNPGASNRPFHQGLFRPGAESPFGSGESRLETLTSKESAWFRDKPAPAPAPAPAPTASSTPSSTGSVLGSSREAGGKGASLFGSPAAPAPAAAVFPPPSSRTASPAVAPASQGPVILKPGDLLEKSVRLKMFEPGKSLCAKSMVKTADGEVISEYFYSPQHGKESRQYIFNTLFALSSLLNLRSKDEDLFQERLETVFSDLLSRLEHGQNIHLEGFISEELNRDILDRMLRLPRRDRPAYFEQIAAKVLARIESVGQARAGLIDQQFRNMPKSAFPPGRGIAA